MRIKLMNLAAGVLALICGLAQGGCCWYGCEREWGSYYNTTSTIWSEPFHHHDAWFGEWGSVGQTVTYSGLFFFIAGGYVTAPIGRFVIHPIEHVTIAPAYDTLMLPIDLCCRDAYLKQKQTALESRTIPHREAD